ncbi:MAG TPA: hypothetical protein VLA92_02555, partial [Candidatus Saccharimonadales bacterium]|nr:hypothetical protein [Candidatus Saccharimonadales bacterium]
MNDNNYQPLQNGIQKSFHKQISYTEQKPTGGLQNIVSCYWSLATTNSLDRDFIYTVMPDACIDIV